MWKTCEHSMETTVLGGLPVVVHGVIAPPDPDVGIMGRYVDDWWITWKSGHRATAVEERVRNSEIEDVLSALINAYEDSLVADEDDRGEYLNAMRRESC